MEKTKYIVLVSQSMSSQNKYKRVYIDKEGKRYIKEKEGYRCIEGTRRELSGSRRDVLGYC